MALTLGNQHVSRAVADKFEANERAQDWFMMARCRLASGGGSKSDVLQYAETFGASPRARALIQAGATTGSIRKDAVDPLTTLDSGTAGEGALSPYASVAGGFIESLKPWSSFDTIASQANTFRKYPMRVRLALTTAVAIGSQVDETSLKPMTSIETDSVQLDAIKTTAFLTCSNELARFGGPEAVALLRTELANACGTAVDKVFLDAMISTVGIRTAASSGLSGSQFVSDLKDALESLDLDSTSKLFLICPPSVTAAIALTNASGVMTFEQMGVTGGSIQGIQVISSNSLSDTMVLLDSRQVAIADSLPIINSTGDACLIFDDAPTGAEPVQSLWQRNEVGIRVERWMSAALIKSTGCAVISDVATVTA